ncbi:MAG: GNAT family N-acetyltransferase [Parvibaculaceae bacterium]|nr:GNAT family N-acetyltransferase [Parvibaculaceae bacterium]
MWDENMTDGLSILQVDETALGVSMGSEISSSNEGDQTHTTEIKAPGSFGRRGNLEVRLAQNATEIDAAQALRYTVFYEEMSAKPDATMRTTKRDVDRFDEFCDHLLVIDHDLVDEDNEGPLPLNAVVGCYRLLRQDVAEQHGGFYTQSEFNIEPLLERAGKNVRFMELGRSCVLPKYRDKKTVELLWKGITQYLIHYNLDVMFGCASFENTNPDELALPLSYLYQNHLTPDAWHVTAREELFVEMNRVAKDDINNRQALRELPPMIRGYVRAGCFIGDGAVVDEQFGTTDVLILFPIAEMNDRYRSKFVAEK